MTTVFNVDCRTGMKWFPDDTFDSIVCDPPYELGFMGKSWDSTGIANDPVMWAEALRVLKPGGHLLAFSGSRTYHRMVCAIEDAGFEIRDQIMWIYGSGFPKSRDVSKAIDSEAGAVREVMGEAGHHAKRKDREIMNGGSRDDYHFGGARIATAPATEAAQQWQGWGTALKPAHEPICVARKPLIGTVAANVLQFGTSAINIDGCRVDVVADDPNTRDHTKHARTTGSIWGNAAGAAKTLGEQGRWPANVIHDGSGEVLAAFPTAPGALADASHAAPSAKTSNVYGPMARSGEPSQDSENAGAVGFKMKPGARRLDAGSAARFFYCAKASKTDRGAGNNHPTVKPTDLMRYLCRLVTPPGGCILDPFAGSGSTGKAAALEGFTFIGFELDAEHTEIANARIKAAA